MARPKHTLWGTTRAPGIRVRIYVDPDIQGAWAESDLKHGVYAIYLHPDLLKHKRLAPVLFHEFSHVLEYANDPEHLSLEVVDSCTAFAQTLEKQLYPLLANLKLESGSGRNPFFRGK